MLRILIIFAFALILPACGPEQSNLQKEKDQMDVLFRQNKAELDQFAGDYVGTFVNKTDRVRSVLRVRSFSKAVVSPTRVETIEVPTIVAFVSNSGGDLINFAFGEGTYDKSAGVLRFFGTGKASITFQLLELQIKGNRLVGIYYNDSLTAPVEYTRSSEALGD